MRGWPVLNRLASEHVLLADGLLVLAVWTVSLSVRGPSALVIAECVTVIVALKHGRCLIPRGRPDQAYLATLRQRFSGGAEASRPSSPARVKSIGAASWRLGLVLAVGVWLVVHPGLPDAPSAGDIPVDASARVIASASGGSQVDAAYDHSRYRFMAIAGPGGMAAGALLSAERRRLIRSGWQCTSTTLLHLLPRGETTKLVPRPCSPSQSRSTAPLISSDQSLRVYLDVIISQSAADQNASGGPLEGNPAIRQALRDHQSVLSVFLANGT